MLRVWNVILVAGAFALSLFGTFLTRSGVISSIHSFTQSSIGPFFLGFIAVVAAFSIALIITGCRSCARRHAWSRSSRGKPPSSTTTLPRRARADDPLGRHLPARVGGRARGRSVGGGSVLRLLRNRLRTAARPAHGHRAGRRLAAGVAPFACQLAWPTGVALAVGVLLLAGGAWSSPAGLIGYTLGAFVLTTIVLEFVRGTRARKSIGTGGWWPAFSGLVARNRRRYGGYVVHASIVFLLVGAVGIGGFSSSREVRLDRGEAAEVGDYRVVYTGARSSAAPTHRRSERTSRCSATASASGRWRPARTATSPRSRPRTRSASALTGCAARTLRDRRPLLRGRVRPARGDREPARQPHLARRAGVRPGRGRRHVARRPRAAPPRAALRRRGALARA